MTSARSIAIPMAAALGVVASRAIPDVLSAWHYLGSSAITLAACDMVGRGLPTVLPCMTWPLLGRPPFRRHAAKLAAALLLLNLVVLALVAPNAQLAADHRTLGGL